MFEWLLLRQQGTHQISPYNIYGNKIKEQIWGIVLN
jgi:hypothetical protein